MATETQTNDPAKMLAFLLSASQGQGTSGADSNYYTPEQELTDRAQALGERNMAHMQQLGAQQEAYNRQQYGSAPQAGSGLVGQLLGGAIGHGLNKYIGGKIDSLNADEELKKQQAYVKAMPANLTPVQQAGYLQQGPTSDLQKTGNNLVQTLLGNQDSASYLQPKTLMSGVQDKPELQQPMQYNQQTRQFEPIPNTFPIGAKIPYGAPERLGYAEKADVRAEKALEQNTALKAEDQKIQRLGVQDKNKATNTGIENQYRDEFNNLIKPHQLMQSPFNKVEAAWGPNNKNPTPADDIAGIYSVMRSYDPNSTVREGEFATAQNAGSVPTRIINAYNKALNGERLTPEQRTDFLNSSKNQYKASAAQAQKFYDRYSTMSQRQGINPENVVTPIGGYEPPPKPTSTAAPLGTKERPKLSPEQARKMLEERGLLKPRGTTGQW